MLTWLLSNVSEVLYMSCGAKLAVGKASCCVRPEGPRHALLQDSSVDEEAAVVWEDHRFVICPRMQRGAYGV